MGDKSYGRQLFDAFWGNLSPDELYQTCLLSFVFFMLVGNYWIMRIVKDTMFETMVGLEHLPLGRMISVIVNIPLVIFYGKALQLMTNRHYILYIWFLGYGSVFMLIGLSLFFVDVESVSFEGQIVGWVTFFAVETFGGICITSFWSYVIDSISTTNGPRIIPFINTFGLVGSMMGPLIAGFCLHEFGFQSGARNSFATCGFNLVLCSIAIKLFAKTVVKVKKRKEGASLFGGLYIIAKEPYVQGILGVSTIYHAVATVTDYQLKRVAQMEIPDPVERSEFMASFGFCTNLVSFLIGIFGTSYFLRNFGLTTSLVAFPFLILCCLFWCLAQPNLYILFATLVVIKALSYALNNPAKEMLYMRTADDVRYQVKSWIDMFGQKVAKGIGAGITKLDFLSGLDQLLFQGTLFTISFTAFWMFVAFKTGRKFDSDLKKETEKRRREEEESGEEPIKEL